MRAVRTKERYILDSLLSVFKGGHWVDDVPVQEILGGAENGSCGRTGGRSLVGQKPNAGESPKNYEQSLYLTVIGGQKYEENPLATVLRENKSKQIIVGEGRGVEALVAEHAWDVRVITCDPDLYGKNARKVNVEQVLSFAPDSPVLLVGNGERVKQARAWLKRANWGREVIEIP